MIETFQSQTSRDFRQRYTGSYGYYTVPETRKRVMVYMLGINEQQVEFVDVHNVRYNALADAGVEFEFIPVQKKLFVHDDRLYLVHRRPARMWARGINAQNTSIDDVATGAGRSLNFKLVTAAAERDVVPVLQKVKALEEKKVNSVALSDLFGVVGSTLYLYDEAVGSFMADRHEISMDEPMFRQEVVDLVERLQLPYKVVING